jgi:uncharacterized Zn finger protein
MINTNNNFGFPVATETVESRQWWVQRWLELLDSYRYKKRLERARIYAREGNVLRIDFKDDRVIAEVQGSEKEPYQVSLSLDIFTDEDWEYVINNLSEKAIFSARLLAGEMPEDIERVFINSGLHLFPFSLTDIHSKCSCPDPVNPCKHIGAVYYQLADRFSEEPFVLFQLRGRDKDRILEALRQLRKRNLDTSQERENYDDRTLNKTLKDRVNSEKTTLDRLSPDLEKFWQYEEPLEPSLLTIVPPIDNKTILDLLGIIPLPSTEADALRQYLGQVYQATVSISQANNN